MRYVNIYMEANPNPASMKFVANFFLVPEGLDFQYDTVDQAADSPLAKYLFGMEFVDKVFIMNNFVTVTKKEEYDWDDISRLIRDDIQSFLAQGGAAVEQEVLAKTFAPITELTEQEETEVITKIKAILEEYIRPAVESDGGAINFHSFVPDTGLVKVQLRGSCSGCPSSTVTLKSGIENLLKRMVPEVQTVEAEGV
jgi:Fe-S cluster biogenesis protein NfuA